MTNHPSLRADLERQLLGACLMESGVYPMLADILSPKNFLPVNLDRFVFVDHQLIYATFEKLYPATPINLLTVKKALEYKVPAGALADLAAGCCSAASVRFFAFVLLEYNFRETFIALLHPLYDSPMHQTAGKTSDVTLTALGEIIDEAMDPENDVFEVIEKAGRYLQKVGAEDHIVQLCETFQKQIDQRIHKIKQQASIECLVTNLTAINGIPHDTTTKMAVSHTTDLLKNILATGKIDNQLANKIFQLKA